MSWMGGLGWKEGLSGVQMQKVTKSSMIFLIKIIRVWWSTISPQMRTWREFMPNTIFSYEALQSKISPSLSPRFFLLFQVEELEKSLSRAQGASQQKQQQLDSLNQGIEKLKRKVRTFRLHRCPLVPVQLELQAQDKRFISIFMQAGSAPDCPTSIDYCWCVDRII